MALSRAAILASAILIIIAATACSHAPLTPAVQERLDADLARCESLRGGPTSREHSQAFGADHIDGRAYARFFKTRVRRIAPESWGRASCGGALACLEPDGTLRLSKRYVELEIPQLVRISLLMHEARHAEGVLHVRCPFDGAPLVSPYQRTDLRGLEECDDSTSGAYALQALWLSEIARRCETCTAQERKQAEDYSRFAESLVLVKKP